MLLKDPVVTVKDVKLRSFSLASLALDVTLAVENPNPVGISLRSLSFDVFYQNGGEWVFLSSGNREGLRINRGSNEITVPATVNNTALLSAIFGMIVKGVITIRISGITRPDFLFVAPKVPFSREITVPLIPGEGSSG